MHGETVKKKIPYSVIQNIIRNFSNLKRSGDFVEIRGGYVCHFAWSCTLITVGPRVVISYMQN